MRTESTHRRVIETIHKEWFNGEPFAIWQVRDAADVSTSSVTRTVKQLVDLKLLVYKPNGFQGRNYRVNIRWSADVKKVIEDFELVKMMERGA